MTSLAHLLPKQISCSESLKEKIIEEILTAYDEIPFIRGTAIKSKLSNLIDDVNNGSLKINPNSTKNILTRYFEKNALLDKDAKASLEKIFKSCIVLILYYQEDPDINAFCKYSSISELLEDYPSFSRDMCSPEELQYLMRFRNIMMVSFIVIPASNNKNLLVKIAARLEGSHNGEYCTGGGQRKCVTRRTDIYYKEGNVQPSKKVRKNTSINESDNGNGSGSGKRKIKELPVSDCSYAMESLLAKKPCLVTLPSQAELTSVCSVASPPFDYSSHCYSYGIYGHYGMVEYPPYVDDYEAVHNDSIRQLVDQDLFLITNSIDLLCNDIDVDVDQLKDPSLPLARSHSCNSTNRTRRYSISSHHIPRPSLSRFTSFTSTVLNSPKRPRGREDCDINSLGLRDLSDEDEDDEELVGLISDLDSDSDGDQDCFP